MYMYLNTLSWTLIFRLLKNLNNMSALPSCHRFLLVFYFRVCAFYVADLSFAVLRANSISLTQIKICDTLSPFAMTMIHTQLKPRISRILNEIYMNFRVPYFERIFPWCVGLAALNYKQACRQAVKDFECCIH